MVVEICPQSREEWREWLRENHLSEKKVLVVCYETHTDKPSFSHNELIREAICFGWIDTTIRRLDEDRYTRTFVRRNENSRWSENTLGYAEEMKEKMSPFGLKMYKQGKNKPVHDHDIPDNPDTPDYLLEALKGKALENYNNLTDSQRRTFLRWLLRAKRQETIDKRVKMIVDKMKKNEKSLY